MDDIPDCTDDAATIRKGKIDDADDVYPYGLEAALTPLPGNRGVDLYLTAHEHSYERTFPVFNGTIDHDSIMNNNVYVNPRYPTHVVSGSGGCREFLDYYDEVFYGPWSAFRSSTYGYGYLQVQNKTHLHWTQLLDEGHGGTDELWYVYHTSHHNVCCRQRHVIHLFHTPMMLYSCLLSSCLLTGSSKMQIA